MKRKIRIVLAQEKNLCLTALRALLDREADFVTLGATDRVSDIAGLVKEFRPDVLACDLSLAGVQCLGAMREVHLAWPDTRILVLTMERSAQQVQAALRAGATGFVLKDASPEDLFSGVRAVAEGTSFLGGNLPVKLFRETPVHTPRGFEFRRGVCSRLTLREHEVLTLVAEGRSSKAIAECLSLSAKTIAKHRANLMRKLDLHNVAALTRFAYETGLLSDADPGSDFTSGLAGHAHGPGMHLL